VVSEHGGAIEVSSAAGETHFKINLPIDIAGPAFAGKNKDGL
jgi:nitrogen-specific signal transduction histidine kinase